MHPLKALALIQFVMPVQACKGRGTPEGAEVKQFFEQATRRDAAGWEQQSVVRLPGASTSWLCVYVRFDRTPSRRSRRSFASGVPEVFYRTGWPRCAALRNANGRYFRATTGVADDWQAADRCASGNCLAQGVICV